jgi:hypothetical protein
MALQSSRDGEQWRLNAAPDDQAATEPKKAAKKPAKKKGDGSPKKNLVAYMIFCKDERPKVHSLKSVVRPLGSLLCEDSIQWSQGRILSPPVSRGVDSPAKDVLYLLQEPLR